MSYPVMDGLFANMWSQMGARAFCVLNFYENEMKKNTYTNQ